MADSASSLFLVLAGFLFALAAQPPRSLHYRLGLPLLLGIVPILMLAPPVLLVGLEWPLPGVLKFLRFYMGFSFQFPLATMLGVALASGFWATSDQRASR
jgi:hypothetical protein